jgi:hypothetical protein
MPRTIEHWLANIRISRKLFIAPGVAIVLLSLTAPLALVGLGKQARLIDLLTSTGAEKSATVTALVGTIPEASSLTNRIVALASNASDAQSVKQLTAEMEKQLTTARSLAEKLRTFELAPRETQVVNDLGKALKTYAEASRQIAALAANDGATAYMMSANGQQAYAELQKKLGEFPEIVRAEEARAQETAMAQNRLVRIGFIALFGTALGMAVLVNLLISRAIAGQMNVSPTRP